LGVNLTVGLPFNLELSLSWGYTSSKQTFRKGNIKIFV
jgi:hypothetical protein